MVMPISGAALTSALSNVQATAPTPSTAPSEVNSSFGDMVAQGIENLDATQSEANNLALKAATGDLTDMHDYLIAATKASLATDLTVAVRNKAVDAFNEIMRMQI